MKSWFSARCLDYFFNYSLHDVLTISSARCLDHRQLDFETEANPFLVRQQRVKTYLALAKHFVTADAKLRARANQLSTIGLNALDALHVAAAERSADFFLTVDDRLLKKALKYRDRLKVKVMSPIQFIMPKGGINA
jgi:hypothetical protein